MHFLDPLPKMSTLGKQFLAITQNNGVIGLGDLSKLMCQNVKLSERSHLSKIRHLDYRGGSQKIN